MTAAQTSLASFDAVFQVTGTTIVCTAVRAPRMNAICERLIGTLRREHLDRVLILNQAHLRAVLADYQEHYNAARPSSGPRTSASPTLTLVPASPQQIPARARSAENRS